MVSKREVMLLDERASESCLHCEINDLVQDHVEGQETIDRRSSRPSQRNLR